MAKLNWQRVRGERLTRLRGTASIGPDEPVPESSEESRPDRGGDASRSQYVDATRCPICSAQTDSVREHLGKKSPCRKRLVKKLAAVRPALQACPGCKQELDASRMRKHMQKCAILPRTALLVAAGEHGSVDEAVRSALRELFGVD